MANIYNDTSAITTNGNASYVNLTVQNAVVQNLAVDNINVDQTAVFNTIQTSGLEIVGLNTGDLLVSTAGQINGLTIGTQNDILVSNAGTPTWTNTAVLNSLTSNTITIPTTFQGDLLVMNASSQMTRLPLSPSGYFLQSDGSNPVWSPLPNPMIFGGLIVNSGLQLVSYPNINVFTDGSGNLINERSQYSYNTGTTLNSVTAVQLYGVLSWTMTNGAWYKMKIEINAGLGAYYGYVRINASTIGRIRCAGTNPLNLSTTTTFEHIYQFTGSSGLQGIGLEGFLSDSGTVTINNFYIYLERVAEPITHL